MQAKRCARSPSAARNTSSGSLMVSPQVNLCPRFSPRRLSRLAHSFSKARENPKTLIAMPPPPHTIAFTDREANSHDPVNRMAALGKADAEAGPEGATTEGADENLNAALGAIGECRRRSQDTGGAAYSQEDWCFSCHSQAAFPAPPTKYQVLPAVSLEILECSCQRPLSILGDSFGLLGITEDPFQVPGPLQLQIQSQALLWDDPRIFRSAELHRPALVSTYTTDMALPRDTGSREPRCEILSFDRALETRGSGGHATDRHFPRRSCLVQGCPRYRVPCFPARFRCVIPCSPPPRGLANY